MPAAGVINKFRLLHGDVSWERTDGSPVADLDSPIYYSSANRIFMGPVSGGGGAGSFSLGVSTGGNTAGDTGVTGTRIVLAGGGEITLSQVTGAAGATISVSAPPQSAQTQNRFNLTLAGNTAGALQEVSSGTLTLAGGPNITISQNGNAITISGVGSGTGAQSAQTLGLFADGNTTGQSSSTTRDARSVSLRGDGAVSVGFSAGSIRISAPVQSVQPETQTFVGGVAASDATYTSGTVQIVALGNVTVRSTTGQQIQISVPAQSVQPETQTFLGGISASDTLYTSGTVRITGVGGGVTVSTNTGQRVDISVAAPVAQTGTQFSAGVSGGNTSGASGTVNGRLVLAGGNRITLSGSTNGASMSVTVSGADAQTGISSIAASNATYTSGQVEFTGSGIVTIRSSAGQRVVVDASQSAQTQNRFNLTLSGNTAGVLAEVSSGTLTLAGGNNITVSQNGNAITISGADAAGAQTAISGISASDTLYTSGTVRITGVGGGITVSSNTGQRIDLSVAAPINFSAGVSNLGNTAGDTGVTGTRLVLVGGQSITLSQATNANGGTITLDGASTSQSVQSVGMYAVQNTTGQSSSTTRDARSISIAGDGIVSVGYSAGSLRISAVQSVQPETQTFIGGISASDTLYTSGTVRFTGVGGGITVSTNTGQRVDLSVAAQSAESQSIGMSNLGNTSGTTGIASGAQVRMLFAGGNNITLSQSLNGASGTLTISAASQTVQSLGMYALGNTTGQSSSTTRDARSVSVEGAGIVSVGYSGGSLRISATQSAQSLGMYAVQNTTGQSSSTTMDARTLSIAGDGAVSVGYSAGSLRISAPVQTGTQFSAGISGGNTAGDTGTVNGRVVLAGGNNITLSGSTNGASETISIVGPNTLPSFSGGISGGNTSGQTGATGTRLVFAGGNNITLSGATDANGGTVTISGANVGGAQTGISGIIASDATYTSGTVQFTGSNMITVKSSAGQRVVIDATQSVQPGVQNLVASDATFSSGTVSISGFGAATVNTAANLIRISVPAQSVQPETQTFIGGISASDTLYTSGTVRITGVGGGITVSSNTGQRIDLSVAAQTDQTLGMYALGNTTGQSSSTTRDARSLSVEGAGIVSVGYSGGSLRISAVQSVQPETQTFIGGISASDTLYTSGTVRFTGVGGGVTVSSNTGQRVDISVAAQTGTQFSAGISGGNTAGDTGTVAGRVVLAGGANITLSGSTNGASETISIVGGAGGAFSGGFSTAGNTAGDTGFVTGRLALVGSNGITLSGSTNGGSQTITISGITQSAESQSIGMSNLGNTSGTTGVASGAQVRMLFAGGNNVTLSQSLNGASGTITISAAAQTDQTVGLYAVGNTTGQSSSTTRDARSISVDGAGIVSVGYSGGSLRISATVAAQTAQSLGMYAVQNTTGQSSSTTMDARTLSIAGDGAVSVGYSAGSLRISAPTQTVQTQGILSAGVSTGGNTAGNTQVSTGSRLVIVGAGDITASQATAAGASTISISGSQSAQTLGMYAVQNTTGQSSSTTMDARTLSAAGDGAVSVGYSAGSLRISAPVQTVESQSIGMSNLGNTSGTTGIASGGQVRFLLVGGNNITLSQSLNGASGTITISAPNLGAGAMSAGVSNLGNSAGATGITGTQLVFVGSDNITLSQTTGANGGTVSIIGGGGGGFSAGASTGGNTAGATGVSGTRMVLVGTNAISLSQTTGAAGNTVSIDAPATSSLVGVSGVSVSTNGSTISVIGSPTPLSYFNPQDAYMQVAGVQGQGTLHMQPMQAPAVQFDRAVIPIIVSISNATSVGSHTISFWQGVYTRNDSTLSLSTSWSTAIAFTVGTTNSSLYGSLKLLTIPITHTLQGGQYWMANIYRTTTAGAGNMTFSQVLASQMNSNLSGIFGAANAASVQYTRGLGTYSATTSALPASIAFSQLTGTGSLVLRQPVFYLASGTV